MTVINLQSSAQWDTILKTHNVVVADFYADWCGPCKMIAPKFESLAREYAQPKKVAFVKVNVDIQRDVASSQSVRAMPTFKLFHRGQVLDTVQGANPSALAAAVASALLLKDKGTPGEVFGTPGKRLGGAGLDDDKHASGRADSSLTRLSPVGLLSNIFMIVGLYFVSLLSLDPYKSAQMSRFNTVNPPEIVTVKTQAADGSTVTKKVVRPAFKTLADL